MELFYTAFLVGLFGSLHCIGMCGPIALALPSAKNASKLTHLTGRVLYNSGRIVSYAILGAVFGLLGQAISLAGFQQGLSIVLGVLMLLAAFLPTRYATYVIPSFATREPVQCVKAFFRSLFGVHNYESLLTIGFLNGFLPCGLVYAGLAVAMSTGDMIDGMIAMVLFGAGTFPVMLAVSLAGSLVHTTFRRGLLRFVPVMMVTLGLLFILRGMSLGIPYLSPKMAHETHVPMDKKADCCHPGEAE